MRDFQSIVLDTLLFDLFQELRKAGMALTLEQYELLQKAVIQGYGLGGWQDIKRVCRLLWVKPCDNYDAKIFDRTFENYIQQHHTKMPVEAPVEAKTKPPDNSPSTSSNNISKSISTNLPQIPPRKKGAPSTQVKGEKQVPVAVQTSSAPPIFAHTRNDFHFSPRDFPIQLQDVLVPCGVNTPTIFKGCKS